METPLNPTCSACFRFFKQVSLLPEGRSLETELIAHFKQTCQSLQHAKPDQSLMCVGSSDPALIIGTVLACLVAHVPICLIPPHWKSLEKSAFQQYLKPSHFRGEACPWGEGSLPSPSDLRHQPPPGSILIPSGGTTGGLRLAQHTWTTLAHAACGLALAMKTPLNTLGVLPLWHVSGLLGLWRTWFSGAQWLLGSWKTLQAIPTPPEALARQLTRMPCYLSLVPTQAQALLEPNRPSWLLSSATTVFLGGAAASPTLLEAYRAKGIPLSVCYGMTETGAMIALQRPEAFLAGKPLAFEVLPHASVSIGLEGVIAIRSPALCPWVIPEGPVGAVWTTEDCGQLDAEGRLLLLGRRDRMIISGGEKIDPTRLEHLIMATGFAQAVQVFGEPDRYWGQRLVARVVPTPLWNESALIEHLKEQLPPYQLPKRWELVAQLNGKALLNQND